jgi:mannose-binding lectin 1
LLSCVTEKDLGGGLRVGVVEMVEMVAVVAKIQVIENLAIQIASTITSKDYTQHFDELRKTLKEHHTNLLYSVPESVSHALTTGGPKIGMMVTIVVLVQVGLAVAYVLYKKRRNSSPKKYL